MPNPFKNAVENARREAARSGERRFDTTPRKSIGEGATFLYDETGIPLRQSARTLVAAPNPVPCTFTLPAALSVGHEVAFDPQVGPFWRVTRIIHTLGPTAPTRHVWLDVTSA